MDKVKPLSANLCWFLDEVALLAIVWPTSVFSDILRLYKIIQGVHYYPE